MNTPQRWVATVNSDGEFEREPQLCERPDDVPDIDVSVLTYGVSLTGFGPTPEAAKEDAMRRYKLSQDPADDG